MDALQGEKSVMPGSQYNPEIHHRHSIRLKGHDYAGGGLYFVTICAHRDFVAAAKGNPFGVGATCMSPVAAAGMSPVPAAGKSPVREIIEQEWRRSAELRAYVELGEFVIMPDHFHALIRVERGQAPLGDVVGAFKASVTRQIHRYVAGFDPAMRIWHRNYYECIVRNPEAERKIAGYIRMNPWKCISHFGNGMRGIGNPSLLNFPKVGVLCSRKVPPDCKLDPPESGNVFIGGFHSPPEKEVLERLLERDDRIISCPAWGLKGMHVPEEWLPALEANRMLILEMKNPEGDLAAAKDRNAFVMRYADRLWIPHATPGGMLNRLRDALDAGGIIT